MKLLTLVLIAVAVTFGAVVWLSRTQRASSDARSRDRAAKGADMPGARPDGAPEHDRDPARDVRSRSARETDDAHAFYFRGPRHELNVPARSIEALFAVAQGLDDEVWWYHLARGDYARWFRDVMGDERLARRAEDLANGACSSRESWTLLRST